MVDALADGLDRQNQRRRPKDLTKLPLIELPQHLEALAER
jgi:hypothetical protein